MGFSIPDRHKRTWIDAGGRLCQLVGAIAVCIYYGRILNEAMRDKKYGDPRWIFATTTGAISGLTALVYIIWGLMLEFRSVALLFAWDLLLAIMWIVVSGIFGKMYLTENPEMDVGIQNMKIAAGFDLANMFLWMISASYCGWVIFVADRKLLFEGRAKSDTVEDRDSHPA